MPSAANAKSEKPPSSEATDNSPIRQIMTIIEHKIRNLEKRKSKLTSYRDLQKAGKELKSDQKVAVAKYDEVVQTLEFARDLSKQIASVATAAEREAKKQAKKEAWIRCTADTNKIREVLLVLDCLMQMGNSEAREDFLNGTNGAVKLTEEDLKILDDLYPEVTPKHEANEEGLPGFPAYSVRAAEHLYSIVDGRQKDVLGTTYCRIKEIVAAVHDCGYFDRLPPGEPAEPAEPAELAAAPEPAPPAAYPAVPGPLPVPPAAGLPAPPAAGLPAPPAAGLPAAGLPAPPAAAGLPAPAYPLRPLPALTLQELEHAYFAQQYPAPPPPAPLPAPPRPLADVIGSQNFYFLQESEIDGPAAPAPPPADAAPIPSQTFTNPHYVAPAPAPPPYYAPPSPPAAPPAAPPELREEPLPAAPPASPPPDGWSEGGARRGAGGDGRYRRYAGRHNGFRGRARPADFSRAPRQYDAYPPRKDERHFNGDAAAGERAPPAGAAPRGRGRGGRQPRPGPRHYGRRPDRPDRPPRADRPE